MQQIQIDKDIPIPKGKGFNLGIMDALRRCEIGDSFQVAPTSRTGDYLMAARINIKVVVRKVDEHQYRVWRVK